MAGSIVCPLNLTPKEKNTYPYMGAAISLPEALRNAVLDNKIFMLTDEDVEYTDLAGQIVFPSTGGPLRNIPWCGADISTCSSSRRVCAIQCPIRVRMSP